MAIDSKYGRVTLEHGDIGDDEPVFVFRAQDRLTPHVLKWYEDLCAAAGAPEVHTRAIAASADRIIEWQATHPTKIPESRPRS